MATTDASLQMGALVAEDLRKLGMRGTLVQMAERGQIIQLQCEMPQCYCPKGRASFDQKSVPMKKWAPNLDHYAVLKAAGGKLEPDNIRLAHVFCNNAAYGWRTKIRSMLAKGKSLDQIADKLNEKRVPRPHGQPHWTAKAVREAFVS